MWKIKPRENMSQITSYFVFKSFILITSGATNPGVPHLTNIKALISYLVARPKSTIAKSIESAVLKIKFSGFKSLCIIFLECISAIPSIKPFIICLDSSMENL